MLRYEDSFRDGLRLFLAVSVKQAQRVAALMVAMERRAEELGGKIFFVLLAEGDGALGSVSSLLRLAG